MAPKKRGVAVNLRDLQREMGVGTSNLPTSSASQAQGDGDGGMFDGRNRDGSRRKSSERWGNEADDKEGLDILRKQQEPERELDWGEVRSRPEGSQRKEERARPPVRAAEEDDEWRKGRGGEENQQRRVAEDKVDQDADWRGGARVVQSRRVCEDLSRDQLPERGEVEPRNEEVGSRPEPWRSSKATSRKTDDYDKWKTDDCDFSRDGCETTNDRGGMARNQDDPPRRADTFRRNDNNNNNMNNNNNNNSNSSSGRYEPPSVKRAREAQRACQPEEPRIEKKMSQQDSMPKKPTNIVERPPPTNNEQFSGRYIPPSLRNKLQAQSDIPDTRPVPNKPAPAPAPVVSPPEPKQPVPEPSLVKNGLEAQQQEERQLKRDLKIEKEAEEEAKKRQLYLCDLEDMKVFAEKMEVAIERKKMPTDWESLVAKSNSLAPVTILIALLLRECAKYDAHEKVQGLVEAFSPIIKKLLQISKAKDPELCCLYDMPIIVHKMGNPRINPEWALLESFWDALYFADLINVSTFSRWFSDVEDETIGRQEGMYQVVAWFDWLQSSRLVSGISEPEDDDEDEDDTLDYEANIPKRIVAKVERSRITARGWGALIR